MASSFWIHHQQPVTTGQGFSMSGHRHLGLGPSWWQGLSWCVLFSGISGLSLLEARSISLLLSCDNQKYLQTLPDVPWAWWGGGGAGKQNQPPVENLCSKGSSVGGGAGADPSPGSCGSSTLSSSLQENTCRGSSSTDRVTWHLLQVTVGISGHFHSLLKSNDSQVTPLTPACDTPACVHTGDENSGWGLSLTLCKQRRLKAREAK